MQNTQTDTAAAESVPASPFHLKLQSQPSLDLDALRLPQNFGAVAGVKKIITTIPVRKPNNQSYVRVRSGDAWRMSAAILQLKEDGECYLVIPALYSELAQEVLSLIHI